MRRGEVWWVRLEPALGSEIAGSEIRKTRPCLIISNDIFNERRRTVIVVPLSTGPQANPPLAVPVRCGGKDVVAVVDQTRAVAKQRLDRKLDLVAQLDLSAVEDAIREILELA